jgi:hypothetical protein
MKPRDAIVANTTTTDNPNIHIGLFRNLEPQCPHLRLNPSSNDTAEPVLSTELHFGHFLLTA